MKALVVIADGFEDSELRVPWSYLANHGINVDIASLQVGRVRGKHGMLVDATISVDQAAAEDYDLLILPGGEAPMVLRQNYSVLSLARSFMAADKLVAAICHGPQILISAGLLSDRNATCYHAIAEELKHAGAHYQDREVVVDRNLVTSRQPSDLPAFMREVMRFVDSRRIPQRNDAVPQ